MEQGDARALATKLAKKLDEVRERKRKLLDALLDGRVKQRDYEEANDGFEQQIAELRIELHEAQLEEMDVETVVRFAEHLMLNAGRMWFEADLCGKQRLQKVLVVPPKLWPPSSNMTVPISAKPFTLLVIGNLRYTLNFRFACS